MAPTKLVVKVEGARNLMPTDGQGSTSAFVQLEFDGMRKTTKVIKRELDPVWREVIDFPINDSADMVNEILDITVFDSSRKLVGKKSKFLGRVSLHGSTFVKQGEETLTFYKLDKKGIFSLVRGELGLTIFYIDDDDGIHHASNAERSASNADTAALNAERRALNADTAALNAQVAALNAQRDALHAELAVLNAERRASHASKGTTHRTDRGNKREHGEIRTHSAARSSRSAAKPIRSSQSMPTRPPPVRTPPPIFTEKTSTSPPPATAESNGHLPTLPPDVAKSSEESPALPPSSADTRPPSSTSNLAVMDSTMDQPPSSSSPLPSKTEEPPLSASEMPPTAPEVLPTVADPSANILRTPSIVAESSEAASNSPEASSQSEEARSPADEQPNPEPNVNLYVHVPEGMLHVEMKPAKGMTEESLPNVESPPNVEVVKPMTEADYALRDTRPILDGDKASRNDLVERMHYLFVRVVKARSLMAKEVLVQPNPYILVASGNRIAKTKTIPNSSHPEWHQVFVFGHHFNSGTVDISVWDQHTPPSRDGFLGGVSFDLSDVPTRLPSDSTLAPEWFPLEHKHSEQGTVSGAIMLSVWIGTQADEAYADAWHSDPGGHMVTTRAKVYLSPKLWYLRLTVIEAQDLQMLDAPLRLPEASVKAQLGFQTARTRVAKRRSVSPFWNEDLMLVASEPFEDEVVLTVEDHQGPDKHKIVGMAQIRLDQVEQRVDDRLVPSRWFNLDNTDSTSKFQGRIHLRICLDGGYHVMDEASHLSSDMRPSAKKLWKASIGVLELGILGAHNLLPMKNKGGRGTTDAYCVAKYGPKWVRTRTVLDSLSPRWNEQYTWEVFEPCTVLTLCVFDNGELVEQHEHRQHSNKHARIGKVRVRLSTLEVDRVYTISYPLMVLQPGGLKKVGDMEVAVRFSCVSMFHLIHTYSKPLLPRMHYLYPLSVQQQEILRTTAMKMVALRLSRCEPPLRPEIVLYMLDADSSLWSMRRSKANWFRISNMMGGFYAILTWMKDIRQWRNPVTTLLVHVLFIILLCYPELILPTIFFYMFLIGLWQFRSRNRSPPHIDPRISHADVADRDELDEEFDTSPTSKPPDIVKLRYERLRGIAGRIQMVLGDIAMQGERLHGLLTWRDPRATSIFVIFCFFIAIWLYIAPFRLAALIAGVHFLRHPRFRDPLPSTLVNFFRRLPTQSDRIL